MFNKKMTDCARRIEAQAQRRQKTVDVLAAVEDPINEEDSDDNEDMDEAPVPVSQRRVRGPTVVPSLALDPGMWLNMNVKPQYLADLTIESMKKFILDYKCILKSVLVNCYAICKNLSWKNIWILS